MEVVYMDPNNPLPDRQYYGRVQLVEVRTEKGMAFSFLPRVTSKYTHAEYVQKCQIPGNGDEYKLKHCRP